MEEGLMELTDFGGTPLRLNDRAEVSA